MIIGKDLDYKKLCAKFGSRLKGVDVGLTVPKKDLAPVSNVAPITIITILETSTTTCQPNQSTSAP